MTIQLNVNPVVAALDTAITAAGIPFGDSNKPTDVVQDRPYVVAFFDGGRIIDRTMLSRDAASVSVVLHTYAWSPDSVRVGRKKTIQALLGLGGTVVSGWLIHPPVHVSALAIEREDRTSPPLYWQTDDFTIRYTPA